jgi:acetylornithine deacetylase/succinyl-diaminopimelate desuccinylase family protein
MKKLDPVKIAQDLISLKSYEGAIEPYNYIKGLLEAYGVKVIEVESKGVKNLHATIGKGKARIGFNGHYDTVPPGKDWTIDPLKPTIEDGKLYGLGSSDMKASVAAMLVAFLELAQKEPPGKIVFQAVGDEEVGGENGTKVLVEKGLYAERMVVGEPSGDSIGYAHKSVMRAELRTFGKSAHAARAYAGDSAILRMNAIINRMEHDNILKMKSTEEHAEKSTTCNIGYINGGGTMNMVPDQCSIGLDIRIPHDMDIESVERYLRQVTGENSTLFVTLKDNGMYTPPDHEFVLTCQKIARDVLKKGVKLSYALGACDGRFFTYKDIPTVKMGVCGFDSEGNRMLHRKNEFVEIKDIHVWKEIFKDVAMHYSKS